MFSSFLSIDNRLQQLREREELKYSAEEKIVEDSESEEDETIKKSVAERREQIQKRLSIERQIPASSQKKEIVQEITEIKRHSVIEDKRAMHEEEIIMQAPTDNIIKSTAIPEPVIKLKQTRKDESSDISKTDFDKELQDKFKTKGSSLDDFEEKAQIVMFEDEDSITGKKIEYDSTITEKLLKDIEDPMSKDYQTEKTTSIQNEFYVDNMEIPRKTEVFSAADQIITDNKLIQDTISKKKEITTIRFLEQESDSTTNEKYSKISEDFIDPELAAKLSIQKEKIVDFIESEKEQFSPIKHVEKVEDLLIDPQLAAKLTVQKEKIIDFVEPEREILSPVKCEMKKTISSDLIDAELSAKLTKQKEKAERIPEDDPKLSTTSAITAKVPITDFGKDFDDQFVKDFHTEKSHITNFLQKESTESISKHITESKQTEIIKSKTAAADNTIDDLLRNADVHKECTESKKSEIISTTEATITNVLDNATKEVAKVLETVKDTEETVTNILDDKIEEKAETKKSEILNLTEATVTNLLDDTTTGIQEQSTKLKSDIQSTVRFLNDAQDSEYDHQSQSRDTTEEASVITTIIDTSNVDETRADDTDDKRKKAAETKSSSGPFLSETDSDEFYKTIEEKITKKLSQDFSAMQVDIAAAGKNFVFFFSVEGYLNVQ